MVWGAAMNFLTQEPTDVAHVLSFQDTICQRTVPNTHRPLWTQLYAWPSTVCLGDRGATYTISTQFSNFFFNNLPGTVPSQKIGLQGERGVSILPSVCMACLLQWTENFMRAGFHLFTHGLSPAPGT